MRGREIMRKPNGYGTVVCLDKTGKKRRKPWAVRITVAWNNGKQQTKYLGYYETQKKAELALANFHMTGMSHDATSITFDELFRLWEEKNTGKLTEKNMAGYKAVYNLTPQLHSKKVKDIKSKLLQDAMDGVNRKYASKSKLKSLWNQMYEMALVDDLAFKNYSTTIELKCVQEESGIDYKRNEIKELWKMYHENESNTLVEDILILIYTGMRINEALGVIPSQDIHFEDGYLDCHGTKNKAADRPIPIHEDIKPLLQKRLNQPYLFLNTKGHKMQYRTFSYAYDKLMDKMGWEHIIHDTRKTFVTILHENNISIEDIASMAGHTQKGITAKVYLKVNIDNLINKISTVKFV